MTRIGPGSVVVVTGASSGIGRATALLFADQGASVVLAARSASSLAVVAEQCRRRGGEALAVETDVADEEQMQQLVDAAVARFGRIDVWVGAASLYGFGRFEEMPADVFRRILEVNLHGQIYGARAVLPQLRSQSDGGAIVFVGSVYSRIATPYVSAYLTSKHALLGFAESLRHETRGSGIRVSTVMPATIDTPIHQHAANYTGREVHPLPPVVAPRRVARAIVGLVERPRSKKIVGVSQRITVPFQLGLPWVYDRVINRIMDTVALRGSDVDRSSGTVFAPDPDSNAVTGGWRLTKR